MLALKALVAMGQACAGSCRRRASWSARCLVRNASGCVGTARVTRAMLRRLAGRSAKKGRPQPPNQLRAVLDTAPDELREPLRVLSAYAWVAIARRWRPGAPTGPLAAARVTLKLLAERWTALSAELTQLDAQIAPLIGAAAPRLLATHGVGPDTAAALLVAAGDNPERLAT